MLSDDWQRSRACATRHGSSVGLNWSKTVPGNSLLVTVQAFAIMRAPPQHSCFPRKPASGSVPTAVSAAALSEVCLLTLAVDQLSTLNNPFTVARAKADRPSTWFEEDSRSSNF